MSKSDSHSRSAAGGSGPQDAERREMLRATGLATGGAIASGLLPGALPSAAAAPTTATRGADIVAMDAIDLSAAIKAKKVSCVEVMDAYLAQIARVNPKINAIVQLQDPAKLRAQAAERDGQLARGQYMGWMHGMPSAVKDTAYTKGIISTSGSPLLKDYVPDFDSIIVERQRAAGQIVIGKTNVPEFALGSNTFNPIYGATVNPYDLTKTVGGSSGGTAAALVARCMPVGDGSDFAGSIRNPSAFCGIYGLRPSAGMVPFGPSPDVFYQQFATEGPMGRTVKDVAMLMSTQSGFDPRVPLSVRHDPNVFAGKLETSVKGKKIAWLGDWNGYYPMDPGVLEICKAQLKTFRDMGCEVDEVKPFFEADKLWKSWLVLRQFIIGCYLREQWEVPEKRALMKDTAQWEVEQSLKLTGQQMFEATVTRSTWHQAVNTFFQSYDFILSPTAQVFPFDVKIPWVKTVGGRTMEAYHQWMGIVLPWSLAGTPVMNLPVGLGAAGVPMGMQLIGKRQDDFKVVQMAHAYEQATRFVQKNVPAIALAG